MSGMNCVKETMVSVYSERWDKIIKTLPPTHFVFLLNRAGIYQNLKVPDESRLWIPKEEYLGKRFDEILPAALAKPRRFYFNEAIETGKAQQYSYPHPITPGRHMTCIITPLSKGKEYLMQVFDSVCAEVPPANVLPDLHPNGIPHRSSSY